MSIISAITLVTVAIISSWSVGSAAHRQRLPERVDVSQLIDDGASDVDAGQAAETPMVRWIDVVSSACAECTHPRGRYSASPADSTVSMTGSPVTRSAIAARCSVHGCDGSGWRCTGSCTIQRFWPDGLQDEDVVDVVMRIESAAARAA